MEKCCTLFSCEKQLKISQIIVTIVPKLKDPLQFLKGQSKKIENEGENDEENENSTPC